MRRAFVTAALVLLTACGGSSAPNQTQIPDPVVAVQRVPLTVAEMPTGWDVTPEGDALASLAQLTPNCNIYDLSIVFPGALATAQSRSFEGINGQQSQSFAGIYASEGEAQAAVDGAQAIVDRCGDVFKDVLKGAAEDQLEALGISLGLLGSIDSSLEKHNDPPLGDSSAGYRVAVKVSAVTRSESFTVDYRIFRHGKIAAASQYAAFGDLDESEERDIDTRLLISAGGPNPTIVE